MTPNEQVVDYILHNGRNLSWHELALKFGCKNGETARKAWLHHRVTHPIPSDLPAITIAPPHRAFDGKARKDKEEYLIQLEDKVTRFEEDLTKGTAQVEALVGQEIKTLEELVDKCKIDLTKWEITKWVQNFWNNRYQVKAYLAPKQEKDKFQQNFVEFLKSYKSVLVSLSEYNSSDKPKGCLIINKQDSHLNKCDINGNNDMEARFKSYLESTMRIVKKTQLSYSIDEIIYVIGSDEFNSEWTGMTTKGTPQQNMVDHHKGFEAICNHEISVIAHLLTNCRNLRVVYMPGNHDEYVGWHMVSWLSAYFKGQRVEFDVSPSYRKYIKFGTSLMMFNHGDTIKPEKLASIFPQEAIANWSSSEYQYIFTGDKHHEKTLDMDGIMFYQLTQSSNSTSKWDSKQGYQAKGFLTAFVISEDYGIGDVLKERL